MTSDRLRVLVVIDALGEGGTERSMAELVPGLSDSGISLAFVTLRSRGDEGVEPLLRQAGVPVHLLPDGAAARLRSLRALVRSARPDVVHSMLFDANLATRLALPGLDVPLLTSVVNTPYEPSRFAEAHRSAWKLRVVQATDAVSGRLAVDAYHAVSAAAADHAVTSLRVPRRRISVVHRGRSDPRLVVPAGAAGAVRDELGIGAEATVLVTLGRQEPQKDLPTLLRAVDPVLSAGDRWLVLAGRRGSASAAVDAELDRMSNRERVVMAGHRGDVPALLAASDLFVMTSRYEGLPGAVIEAMAAGLPVVASDIAPVREVVEAGAGGPSAVLAPRGDPERTGRALAELVEDPDRRDRLGRAGRARYEACFTVGRSAHGMAELYREVARRHRG